MWRPSWRMPERMAEKASSWRSAVSVMVTARGMAEVWREAGVLAHLLKTLAAAKPGAAAVSATLWRDRRRRCGAHRADGGGGIKRVVAAFSSLNGGMFYNKRRWRIMARSASISEKKEVARLI